MPALKQETSPSVCAVCGENANGHFFGALVCLPCKSFFIRCNKASESVLPMPCNCRCSQSKQGRIRCQKCRYLKCLAAGMVRKEKPESVEPGHGQILCHVCGDIANGIHFGIKTCEGCKKFFRRGLLENRSYVCTKKEVCTINPRNRNNCRFCRYRKCVSSGMSRDSIKMGRPKKNRDQVKHNSKYRTLNRLHPTKSPLQNESKKETKYSTSYTDSHSSEKAFVNEAHGSSLTLKSLLMRSLHCHTDEHKQRERQGAELASRLESPCKKHNVPQIIVNSSNNESSTGCDSTGYERFPCGTPEKRMSSTSKTKYLESALPHGCTSLSMTSVSVSTSSMSLSPVPYLHSPMPSSLSPVPDSLSPVPLALSPRSSLPSSASLLTLASTLSPTSSSSLSSLAVPRSPSSGSPMPRSLSPASSSLSPSSSPLSSSLSPASSSPSSSLSPTSLSVSPSLSPELASLSPSSLSPALSSLSTSSSSFSVASSSLSPMPDSYPDSPKPTLTTTEIENMLMFLTSEDVKESDYLHELQSADWNHRTHPAAWDHRTVENYFMNTLTSDDEFVDMAVPQALGITPPNENINMNMIRYVPNMVHDMAENHQLSVREYFDQNKNSNDQHFDVFSEVHVKTEIVNSFSNQKTISDNDRSNSNYMDVLTSNVSNGEYFPNTAFLDNKHYHDRCNNTKSSNVKPDILTSNVSNSEYFPNRAFLDNKHYHDRYNNNKSSNVKPDTETGLLKTERTTMCLDQVISAIKSFEDNGGIRSSSSNILHNTDTYIPNIRPVTNNEANTELDDDHRDSFHKQRQCEIFSDHATIPVNHTNSDRKQVKITDLTLEFIHDVVETYSMDIT